MKCFYHPTVDAVGTCKSCCRALCRDCIVEVGLSCSCRGRCETDVAILNELVERSRIACQKTSATFFNSGIFMLLLGAIFLLAGVLAAATRDRLEVAAIPFFFGLVFTAWGISSFVSAKRIAQK